MAESALCVEFGKHVRFLRRIHGMTQGDLAERVGVERTSITNIEGGNQNPTLGTVERIANAFGVHAFQLLRGIETDGGQNEVTE